MATTRNRVFSWCSLTGVPVATDTAWVGIIDDQYFSWQLICNFSWCSFIRSVSCQLPRLGESPSWETFALQKPRTNLSLCISVDNIFSFIIMVFSGKLCKSDWYVWCHRSFLGQDCLASFSFLRVVVNGKGKESRCKGPSSQLQYNMGRTYKSCSYSPFSCTSWSLYYRILHLQVMIDPWFSWFLLQVVATTMFSPRFFIIKVYYFEYNTGLYI